MVLEKIIQTNSMLYQDRIYGQFEIDEPVILELINTHALQRLKKVEQAGYFEPFIYSGDNLTRFEHSLGVYLLLKKYNAPLEEQIAGLIHDVSHAAFSHCIDYVLDEGSGKHQNHQDNVFEEFVRNSELPKILGKYNLDIDYILDDKNFPLKERGLPDLCADRIDYSLRTALVYKFADRKNIDYFLNNLTVKDNKWLFKDFASAKKYADLFLKMNRENYAGLPSVKMFRTVGDCLRYTLQQGYVLENDLYTTDEAVIAKIKNHLDDEKLNLLWQRMNNKIKVVNNPDDYDAKVYCKSRIVDPLCHHQGEIKRVSEIEPSWQKIIEQELKPKVYFLKFEK